MIRQTLTKIPQVAGNSGKRVKAWGFPKNKKLSEVALGS